MAAMGAFVFSADYKKLTEIKLLWLSAKRSAVLLLIFCAWTLPVKTFAQGNSERVRQDAVYQIKNRLVPILTRFCRDSCEITNVVVDVDESLSDNDDIGFEAVAANPVQTQSIISKVSIDIQVDDRVSAANRDRLEAIINNNLRSFGPQTQVHWAPIQLPQIGQSEAMEEELRRSVQSRVTAAVQKVIETYCPKACVLSRVSIDSHSVTPDQASALGQKEVVRDRSGQGAIKIDNVDIEIGMDDALTPDERAKIANVIKAKTKFVEPVNLEVSVSSFPEAYTERKDRKSKEEADPFGLEKLRETLKIFHELASTKEIITHDSATHQLTNTEKLISDSKSSHTNSSESSSNSSAVTNNHTNSNSSTNSSTDSKQSSNNNSESSSKSEKAGEQSTLDNALYIGAALLLAGILVALIMRVGSARKDAQMMMAGTPRMAGMAGMPGMGDGAGMGAQGGGELGQNGGVQGVPVNQAREMIQKLRRDELKNELVNVFVQAPKVARETFSRLLLEEGVEETSKYVFIFGHMVIFELLEDPNIQRDLYALSEYYQKTKFNFTLEDEIELLNTLKTRVTANEIRVLSRKQTQLFDFLGRLDSGQIFNLVCEEKPQVQSIVLTQLDPKRRRAVFDMYQGEGKVALMRELCRADAIPKEYLANVARALNKKVQSRPEFDTENLRSSDILLDLLEKANIEEQRALMRDLVRTNPEAARGIKLKLVTVEMLPYLKDGHLLELVLGMERSDLVTFLAGTREYIRDLFLAKAPPELAQTWVEELEHVAGVEEASYRLVELKILGRVRHLANNGAINLLGVNDIIFGGLEQTNINQPAAMASEQPTNANRFSAASMVA